MRRHGAEDEYPPSGELSDYRTIPLADRITLLTGADTWHTAGNPVIGLRPLTVSDGPAGVRGATMDERVPAAWPPVPFGARRHLGPRACGSRLRRTGQGG